MAQTAIHAAVAQFTADTSTFDVTIAGETRTPTGVVVFCTNAEVLNSGVNDASLSVGGSDFTDQWCCSASSEHNVTPTDCSRAHSESVIVNLLDEGTTTISRSATVAAISGGVRFTPIQSGNQYRIAVWIIFGSACKSYSFDNGGTWTQDTEADIAHGLATAPKAGIHVYSFEDVSVAAGDFAMSLGFHAYDNPTIKQSCIALWDDNGADPSVTWMRHSDSRVHMVLNLTGGEVEGTEVTAIDATNFSLTARAGGIVDKVCGLLIECDDIETDLAEVTHPTTAASDWAVTDFSFEPQFAALISTANATLNNNSSGTSAGCIGGIGINSDGKAHTANVGIEDAVSASADTESNLFSDDSVLGEGGMSIFDTGGICDQWGNVVFDSLGWDVAAADIQSATTGTRYYPTLVFGIAPSGTVINRVLTSTAAITDPIPGSIFTKKRPGERIELFTDALFIYYTYARLVQDNFSLTDQIILEQNLRRQLLDSANINDVVNTLVSYYRQLSDSISLTDDIRKTIIVPDSVDNFVTVQDSVDVSDSIFAAFVGTSERIELDSLLVNEAALIQRFRARTAPEQIAIIADLLRLSHHKIRNDYVAISDDLIVSRSAIINSATVQDSISVNDLLGNVETGTLLPPSDIEIEHGIENQ